MQHFVLALVIEACGQCQYLACSSPQLQDKEPFVCSCVGVCVCFCLALLYACRRQFYLDSGGCSGPSRSIRMTSQREKTTMKLLFSFFAAQMWNKLPSELRLQTKLSTFTFKLKTHLFSTAFDSFSYIKCNCLHTVPWLSCHCFDPVCFWPLACLMLLWSVFSIFVFIICVFSLLLYVL